MCVSLKNRDRHITQFTCHRVFFLCWHKNNCGCFSPVRCQCPRHCSSGPGAKTQLGHVRSEWIFQVENVPLLRHVCFAAGTHMSYFIDPSMQRRVAAAVFYIIDEAGEGGGIGVFFSHTRAVTCDHNLLLQHVPGSEVSIVLPGKAPGPRDQA